MMKSVPIRKRRLSLLCDDTAAKGGFLQIRKRSDLGLLEELDEGSHKEQTPSHK